MRIVIIESGRMVLIENHRSYKKRASNVSAPTKFEILHISIISIKRNNNKRKANNKQQQNESRVSNVWLLRNFFFLLNRHHCILVVVQKWRPCRRIIAVVLVALFCLGKFIRFYCLLGPSALSLCDLFSSRGPGRPIPRPRTRHHGAPQVQLLPTRVEPLGLAHHQALLSHPVSQERCKVLGLQQRHGRERQRRQLAWPVVWHLRCRSIRSR